MNPHHHGPVDIKAWREAHSLTQAELARMLDVDQMSISRWERGTTKRFPSSRILELALAELDRRLATTRNRRHA